MHIGTVPWSPGAVPLMLAPMQGHTNRGLRDTFAQWVRPDVLFTEFVRVRPGARELLSATDRVEALHTHPGIPLVVQLIGIASEALIHAARALQDLGVRHVNLNMGCPYGRQTSSFSGGGMFRDRERLPELFGALRETVSGSLSIKTRTGTDDPRQIFELLPLFEDAGIDFLVLHPRTVGQRFDGHADHELTAEVVRSTSLPVIANGDIFDAPTAQRVLSDTGAHGLMLGRGALRDPLLFERIRGRAPSQPTVEQRADELRSYFSRLAKRYAGIFHGDAQVLGKLKGSLAYVDDFELSRWLTALRRAKRLDKFRQVLEEFRSDAESLGRSGSTAA